MLTSLGARTFHNISRSYSDLRGLYWRYNAMKGFKNCPVAGNDI